MRRSDESFWGRRETRSLDTVVIRDSNFVFENEMKALSYFAHIIQHLILWDGAFSWKSTGWTPCVLSVFLKVEYLYILVRQPRWWATSDVEIYAKHYDGVLRHFLKESCLKEVVLRCGDDARKWFHLVICELHETCSILGCEHVRFIVQGLSRECIEGRVKESVLENLLITFE